MSNFEITVTSGDFKFQLSVKDGNIQKIKTEGTNGESEL